MELTEEEKGNIQELVGEFKKTSQTIGDFLDGLEKVGGIFLEKGPKALSKACFFLKNEE